MKTGKPGVVLVLVASALLAALGGRAAATELPRGVAGFETVKVADGVYAFLAPESNGPIVSGNSVAIIGEDGVLVVDSGHAPTVTERMLAQIRQWTDKPVTFLVNTHWHPDHNSGNGVYKAAFPGLQIVSTPATRAAMQTELPKKEINDEMIAQVREIVRKGTGPTGKPLSEDLKSYYQQALEELDGFYPELKKADHALPTVVFKDEMTVYLGKREVRILFLGRGNTAGDAVVYVPDSKVLITGDLVVAPIPYPFGSFIGEWTETMKKLRALDAAVIIPGHGPVMHDSSYLDLVIELLQATTAQAQSAVKNGVPLAEAAKTADFSQFRQRFAQGNAERERMFNIGYVPAAMRRAYREAKEGPLKDED